MYIFFISIHNINGDYMDLDIRKHVINNLKEDKESILDTIEESLTLKDEMVLPGLGVILELFWNELSKEEKDKIVNIINDKII